MADNKKINKILLLNCLLFSIFFIWNHWQPLTADDYDYSFSNVIHNGIFLEAIKIRYFNWSARFSADTLEFLFLGEHAIRYTLVIANIINSLVLLGIINLLAKMLFIKNYTWQQLTYVAVSFVGFFIATSWFPQDFMWKTVAIQYAWGFCLFLFVFWRFYLSINNNLKSSFLDLFGFLLAGLFLGAYNEVFIAAIADIYLTTLIVWYIFKKDFRQLWQLKYFVFLFGVLASGIILILAPGNYARLATQIDPTQVNTGILLKIAMTYVQFFRYGYHVAFAIIIVFTSVWLYRKHNKLPNDFVQFLTFLFILLNIHILSFVGIAYYAILSGRIILLMDTILYLILAKLILAKFELSVNKQVPKGYRLLLAFIAIGLVAYVSFAYYNLHQFIKMRQEIIVSKQYQAENFTKTYFIHLNGIAAPNLRTFADEKKAANPQEQNLQNAYLPEYKVGKWLSYPVYFDTLKDTDGNFIRMYLEQGVN